MEKIYKDIKDNPFDKLNIHPDENAIKTDFSDKTDYLDKKMSKEQKARFSILFPDPDINIDDIKRQLKVSFRYIGPRPWINLIQKSLTE